MNSGNYLDAIKAIKHADKKVRLEQIVQGAEVMALALRSNSTGKDEALANAVEAIRDAAIAGEAA